MTNATQPSHKPQVALFITCLSDQFFPRVGVAVTKILE
jgi:Fe-S oxidoreductase